MNLTRHAESRMQQRGISRQALDYLLAYGRESYDHRGCQIFWFDKRARQRVCDEQGCEVMSRLEKSLNTFAVITLGGTIITVGHRHKKIWRH